VSELRIRSEAVREEAWAQAFLPPQVDADDRFGDAPEGDFAPFLSACTRALAGLFGVAVDVLPGRPGAVSAPRIAPELAGLLATVRMGGDPARPSPATGVAQVRYGRIIADTLDAVAARVWPVASRAAGYDLDISCGAVAGRAHVMAPAPLAVLAVPEALPGPRIDDLPLRMRVELASDMVLVASLLPLRAGCVLPISPVPDMPLIVGDHRIGRATITPLADGRQQATIVEINVVQMGARP
jgi:hypothetical protein